jgi:hypothetical protein
VSDTHGSVHGVIDTGLGRSEQVMRSVRAAIGKGRNPSRIRFGGVEHPTDHGFESVFRPPIMGVCVEKDVQNTACPLSEEYHLDP